jgi:hypothetical protein
MNSIPFSVVIPTVCRPDLLRCVRSIFHQNYACPIQILIGVDVDKYSNLTEFKLVLDTECPSHIDIFWLNLDYSTSKRHGGLHACYFGGSLRTALSFLAKYEHVMYLDDDDWLHPDHFISISKLFPENDWGFAYCMYADSNLSKGLLVDHLESVGVNKGIYKNEFGGFVRPSGMVINKLRLIHLLTIWSFSLSIKGDGEDRIFFSELKKFKGDCTEEATVYYSMDPNDDAHSFRLKYLNDNNINFNSEQKNYSLHSENFGK